MFESFRRSVQMKLLTYSLKRQFKKREVDTISLSDCWLGIKTCVICLPESGIDDESLSIILEKLYWRFNPSEMLVVTPIGFSGEIPSSAKVFKLRREDFGFWGLPTRSLINRLRELNADMAVDLSPVYNPLTAYCCQLSGARVKVSFALDESDLVFNYQISPKDDREGVDRYRVLAEYIG